MYPSDIVPSPPSLTRSHTVIVNTDPHTAKGTFWLAIHLQPRSYSGNFLDSYGLHPHVPSILIFLRPAYSVWEYNISKLQGLNCIAVFSHSTWTVFIPQTHCGPLQCSHRRQPDQPLIRIRLRTATCDASRRSVLHNCWIYKRYLSYSCCPIQVLALVFHTGMQLSSLSWITGSLVEYRMKPLFRKSLSPAKMSSRLFSC